MLYEERKNTYPIPSFCVKKKIKENYNIAKKMTQTLTMIKFTHNRSNQLALCNEEEFNAFIQLIGLTKI